MLQRSRIGAIFVNMTIKEDPELQQPPIEGHRPNFLLKDGVRTAPWWRLTVLQHFWGWCEGRVNVIYQADGFRSPSRAAESPMGHVMWVQLWPLQHLQPPMERPLITSSVTHTHMLLFYCPCEKPDKQTSYIKAFNLILAWSATLMIVFNLQIKNKNTLKR